MSVLSSIIVVEGGGAMSTLSLKAMLNRKYIAKGKQTLCLLIEILANDMPLVSRRLPLNLSFVLDRSGSMTGEKLEYTKQAVRYALDHLTPEDKASIVVYDQEVQVLSEAGAVTYKDSLKGIISQVYPGGSTNLSGGMIQGYRQVMQHRKNGQVDRVLLLTDGLANVGVTDPALLAAKATSMRESGVSVTTIGVGADFNEDLLTAIAEGSGGNYYYIDSPERIPDIFTDELKELLSVVGQNVEVAFKSAAGVKVNKVWGYKSKGDQVVEMALPDLFASDRKALMLEIEVKSAASGLRPLGTVRLTYDDAGGSMELTTCEVDLEVFCTDDQELLSLPEEPEVSVQLELSKAAEDRNKALHLADQGDVEAASGTIQASIDSIKCCLAMANDGMQPCLADEIDRLTRSKEKLQKGRYDKRARKEIAYESYQSRNARKK